MSRYIIRTSTARMPSSCWGQYRRVAVIEVDDGVQSVKMISERARGVRKVVRVWDKLNVGKTERCAYERAIKSAESLISSLENAS